MTIDSSSSLGSQGKCPSMDMDKIMTIDSDSSLDRAESIRKSCDEIMTITDSSDKGISIHEVFILIDNNNSFSV